jgi:hypothetical protein
VPYLTRSLSIKIVDKRSISFTAAEKMKMVFFRITASMMSSMMRREPTLDYIAVSYIG